MADLEDAAVQPRPLTQREAARYLGVDVTTLRRWTRAGRLPVARLGARTLRYRRADLDALVDRAVTYDAPPPRQPRPVAPARRRPSWLTLPAVSPITGLPVGSPLSGGAM